MKCPYLPGQRVNVLEMPSQSVCRRDRSVSMTGLCPDDAMTLDPSHKFRSLRPPSMLLPRTWRRTTTATHGQRERTLWTREMRVQLDVVDPSPVESTMEDLFDEFDSDQLSLTESPSSERDTASSLGRHALTGYSRQAASNRIPPSCAVALLNGSSQTSQVHHLLEDLSYLGGVISGH